ncbi:pilus assembly protein TadG-related protein [Mariprofundus aestuarium]|nr:pilus assembly protein TadG-related protein [Mariprofundus aestuarium]
MQSNKERGAVLVMAAIFSVVLIGIAALAVDVGRLFVLHSEMHNAADAAALAGAAELDGQPGAQARARAAARTLLSHQGSFATNQELLNDATALPDSAITFYCAIGSEYDFESGVACAEDADPAGSQYFPASGDADSHYVKVTLQSDDADTFYVIDLFFFPVLSLLPTVDATLTASAHAEAIAGKHDMICNYPPLMICDPFEFSGGFKNVMVPGHMIQLKLQQSGVWWAPGDFGFLQTSTGPGAMNLADYIADEQLTGCTPAIVTSEPGGNTGPTTRAISTRFDEYINTSHYDWPEYPPAPVVIDYPRDAVIVDRIGDGNWDRATYWANFHASQGHGAMPGTETLEDGTTFDFASATRWQVYNWEIEQTLAGTDRLPCYHGYPFLDKFGNPTGDTLDCTADDPSASIPSDARVWIDGSIYKLDDHHGPVVDGKPDPTHLNAGAYPPPRSIPKRRELHIATLSCDALGMKGKMTVPVTTPDGFAKIFLTEHTVGPPSADLTGEYIGWSKNTDSDYYVEIQLYE